MIRSGGGGPGGFDVRDKLGAGWTLAGEGTWPGERPKGSRMGAGVQLTWCKRSEFNVMWGLCGLCSSQEMCSF